jgi:death on curing protein
VGDPVWLNRRQIDVIHQRSIEKFGGSHGLRDANLLESALARPQNLHAYGENDAMQLAASYAEALSQNHLFIDGNKRVAFEAADIFLYQNGHDLLPSKGDRYADMIERLAQSQATRQEVAEMFRENVQAREQEKPGQDRVTNPR